jgi:hemolysin III
MTAESTNGALTGTSFRTAISSVPRLYDSGRDLLYVKPLLRGWLHLLSFVAALAVGSVLIATTPEHRVDAVVYAASVAGLFGASALYHRPRWSPAAATRLQRIDHVMIVMMIAGSATPAIEVCAPAPWRVLGLVTLWTLATAAIATRLLWMSAPERLVGAIYVGLGWIAGTAVPAVWINAGVAPAVLLTIGGVLYTVGAIGYHQRRPDRWPAVFGYHEVFHAYVTLAAACQYVAIGCFLM